MFMSTPLSNNEEQQEEAVEEELTSIEEDNWNLPSDFDLFATHQVRRVYYPNENPNSGKNKTSTRERRRKEECSCGESCSCRGGGRNRNQYFEIECIEPSSPLDILNKSQSLKQYDATGHCVWTGAFLLISCIDRVLNVVNVDVVEQQRRKRGKSDQEQIRMIELGCGTGIGGLSIMLATASASAGAESAGSKKDDGDDNRNHGDITCCFTDYDPAVLEVCRRNCKLNGLVEGESFTIEELTWGVDFDDSGNHNNGINDKHDHDDDDNDDGERVRQGSYDVVLATDVLYDVDLIPPLFSTVSKLLSVGNQKKEDRDNENYDDNKNGDEDEGRCKYEDNEDKDNRETYYEGDGSGGGGVFILSHVPRACYNDNNPPEAVENLEKYIIDQAREKYGLHLKDVIRAQQTPPVLQTEASSLALTHDNNSSSSSRGIDEECRLVGIEEMESSFAGSAIFVFSKVE